MKLIGPWTASRRSRRVEPHQPPVRADSRAVLAVPAVGGRSAASAGGVNPLRRAMSRGLALRGGPRDAGADGQDRPDSTRPRQRAYAAAACRRPAAGRTGMWTQSLASRTAELTAVDAAPEALAIATAHAHRPSNSSAQTSSIGCRVGSST